MFYTKTVEPDTLSLIRNLQSRIYINDFILVGGTALALQLGHRKSIDIDLFSNKRFEVDALLVQLQQDFSLRIRNQMGHALLVEIKGLRVDFVFQPSEMLNPPILAEGIRMASPIEIAAMKIGAITSRGRKRDFVDLFCLLKHYSLDKILEAFLKKYPDATMELAMRSLFYLEDANQDPDPNCFFDFKWEDVRAKISSEASKL